MAGRCSVICIRECERRRVVAQLREVHILRDSWTKLNVSPAKIMQVYVCLFGVLRLEYINAAREGAD